jgi:hypothetical protein
MTFRNEVLEGIAAYKAMTPTGQDNYYNEKAKIAKRENDDYEEQQRWARQKQAEAAANKAAGQPSPLVPTQSRSDTIGSGPPPSTPTQVAAAPPSSNLDTEDYSGTGGTYRRGGRIRRFADGGSTEPGGFASGLASGLKSTFRLPQRQQAINTNRTPADAGIPGSNDAAVNAAVTYGPAPAPADDGTQYRRGGRISRGRAIHTGYQSGGRVEKNPYHTEMTEELYPGAGQGEGDEEMSDEDIARLKAGAGKGGTLWEPYSYEDEPGRPTPNLPEQPRRVRRFQEGGALGAAFRGGRPEYDPSQDPRVQERNQADEIIRQIISADVGEPNEANDPSIELRERGQADRAAARQKVSQQVGQPPKPPGQPLEYTPRPDQAPDPSQQINQRGGEDRDVLEAAYRSSIPAPEDNPDPSAQIMGTGQDRDDAYLSTDNARQPPRGGPGEPDEPTLPGRPGNARPAETQIPDDPNAKYPTTAPGPYTRPTSRLQDIVHKYVPSIGDQATGAGSTPAGVSEEGTERAGDAKWVAERRGEIARLRVGLTEAVTPEDRERREARIAEIEAELAQGTPSQQVAKRAADFDRRKAMETNPPPVPDTSTTTAAAPTPAAAAPAAAAPAPAEGDKDFWHTPINQTVQKAKDDLIRRLGGTPAGATPAPTQTAAAAPATPPTQLGPEGAAGSTAAPTSPEVAVNTRPPGAGNPADYGKVTQRAAGDPDYIGIQPETPTKYPTTVPTRTAGTNTPGGSAGATTAAPPGGSAGANQPTDATKMAPGPGGTQVPKGSLQDQTRTAAYVPGEPGGVAIATGPPTQLVPQGDGGPPGSPSGYTNQQIAQTLTGAASLVRPGVNGGPPPVGHLAASRPVFNAFVQAHDQGGRLTPGEAMVAGMVGRYMAMMSQGRVQQANMMAYGILQAANLEAASHGAAGRDKLLAGDTLGAKRDAVAGLNYMADGVTQTLSPDGNYIISTDPRTHQVTGQTPIDGRVLLQTLLGLDNGTLFWKTLEASAAMLQKPDRNAEGRALANDLRRRQIALADQRLLKGNQPRAGATTSTGMSKFQTDLARIRGERPPQRSVVAGAAPDNTDLTLINYDVRDPEPEPETAEAPRRSPSDLDEEDLYA